MTDTPARRFRITPDVLEQLAEATTDPPIVVIDGRAYWFFYQIMECP